MSEAAERIEAWRRAKRQAGYRPVLLWLPIEAKAELDALAYERKQDIATCVVEAVRALAASQGVRRPLKLDAHQYSRLLEELAADLQRRFFGTAEADTPPAAPTPPVPPPRRRAKTGGKQGLAPESWPPSLPSGRSIPTCPMRTLASISTIPASIRPRTGRRGSWSPCRPGVSKSG